MVSHAACKPRGDTDKTLASYAGINRQVQRVRRESFSTRSAFPCNDVMGETITLWRKLVSVEYHVSTRLEYVYETYLTHDYTRIISI